MDQGLRLRREQALLEYLGLALDAFREGQGHRASDGLDGPQRSRMAAPHLLHLGRCGLAQLPALVGTAELAFALADLLVGLLRGGHLGREPHRPYAQVIVPGSGNDRV